MNRDQLAARISRRYDRTIAELEQMIRDITWWNHNRLDAPPFDTGSARVLLAKEIAARQAWREQLENDTPKTRERHSALSAECAEFAEKYFSGGNA